MPLSIIRGDITSMRVDAVVNAANSSLLGGGGVDGAIHIMAGPELLEECRTLGGCKTGEAKLTKGYNMPCRYIIHTVGPVWQGGGKGEEKLLYSCYENSLLLARENGCKTVAFPIISAGVYGYPKDEAIGVAVKAIGDFLAENEMDVTLIVFDMFIKGAAITGEKLYGDVEKYIADNIKDTASADISPDGTFSQALAQLKEEKGLTDRQLCHKSNITGALPAEMRGNEGFTPEKRTALALAIAFELDAAGTDDLLKKAGFTLSDSIKADVIVKYFIEKKCYDIYEINKTLFAFEQPLLGG